MERNQFPLMKIISLMKTFVLDMFIIWEKQIAFALNIFHWVFPICGNCNTNFGTVPPTKLYTDTIIKTSLVHGQQKLVCWFSDYCTKISGPRVWRNLLLSLYALAQGSIWSNCLNKCRINPWKLWKHWRCCVK